ncbi:MAG: GreA/GreB family elongation factor [Lentisphaerae bacterium]|nr:GreA/GreB family elongation factor [Lentisphaerota bacterium]
MQPDWESQNNETLETWFVDAVSADPLPAGDMLAVLDVLAGRGETARAEEWADLMQDAAAEQGDGPAGIRLWRRRLAWPGGGAARDRACARALRRIFRDRTGSAFLKAAGCDTDMPAQACLERLERLLRLEPGAFCFDKTWGFGVVTDVDALYERITIDFDRKPGQALSFAYAAETLELVPDEHLLAVKHREPEQLAALIEQEPETVVRMALRDFGPLHADRLRELLTQHVLAEDAWKPFWEAARKALKRDPLVELPARRREPIRLRAEAKAYDAAWFASLAAERDPGRILERVAEWEAAEAGGPADEAQRRVLAERLDYAARAYEGGDPAGVARCLLAADRLGMAAEAGAGRRTDALLDGPVFVTLCGGLAVRELRAVFAYLVEHDAERAAAVMQAALPELGPAAASETVDALIGLARREACVDIFRTALRTRPPNPALVCRLCRDLKDAAWPELPVSEVLNNVVDALANTYSGESLKAQHQLRDLMGRAAWLRPALEALGATGRENLLRRIDAAQGWDLGDRRSAMAGLIRLYPELERVLAGTAGGETRGAARLTSWRSYRARREQLRQLVEELIPGNSREIAVARSYGDLSENHEYKAAKEHQGILLRRRGELERDLEAVQGTDFAGMPTDRAGMGTRVELEYEDGTRRVYSILGEWDREEALGVISSRSALAGALEGHGPDARVSFSQDREGPQRVRIVSVGPLSEAVREWSEGR